MISTNFHIQSPYLPSTTSEFRLWRRRRLKFHQNNKKNLSVSCQLGGISFGNLFQNVNSLQVIAPATLGFASGLALYISQLKKSHHHRNLNLSDLGEWILFTSPTPFNRFVLLRCPSIMFQGSELLEDLNDKLVKEDRHFVKLISGKIQLKDLEREDKDFQENLVYQRTCVSTGDDGGVISLDWPAKLGLMEEHGMDTTVVIVPGTTEGSGSKNIRSFVCELLKRGCFPVVMNPRGCACSPLTTARLFTAADSDDICTAVQFINKARPWNTLMAIGWGHGANMLTKYLAEVAERTPLTAAVCIDNPFDLEEATRSFPFHVAVDQKLTSGMKDILRSNKELFQGRAKGFNVEKALSATSLRDFESEISMVSYGFESIEKFYAKSSTRELVGNVKIPLLFIQSDDGTIPPFSIPRSSIAENPFTSMLLCSLLSTTLTGEQSVLPWCQQFAVEWLTAVELGLLKGRHPLLNDVDVTINPSAGLALVESRASNKNSDANNFLNVTEVDALNGYRVGSVEDNMKDNIHLGPPRNVFEGVESQQGEIREMSEHNGSDETALINKIGENSADNERSQVLQSARAVMNMLDVTMPGTLQEEQKKKVLTAMEQGETLVRALEGAVPEDVRGTLTNAVSEIVKTQGPNLNLNGLKDISLVPSASFEVKLGDELPGGTDKKEPGMEMHPWGPESDIQPAQSLQNSLDQGQAQSGSNHNGDIPCSGGKKANEVEQNQDKEDFLRKRVSQSSGDDESESGIDTNLNQDKSTEKADDPDFVVSEQGKANQDGDIIQMSTKEANGIQRNEETNMDVSNDENKPSSTTKMEESMAPVTSSPEPSMMEESNHLQKGDDKNIQPMEDQNKQGPSSSEAPAPSPSLVPTSASPSFNVSEALDALTGFDDSTQVAVKSVFGVLENMIAKLEENGQEIDEKQANSKDGEPSSASEESPVDSETEDMARNIENNKSALNLESDQLQYSDHVHDHPDKSADLPQDAHIGHDEKQLIRRFSTALEKNCGSSDGSCVSNHGDNKKDKRMNNMINSSLSAKNSVKAEHICKLPLSVTVNPFGDSMYNEYLRRYLLSEMPNTKSLDLNSTADLLLDYFPEEGQWKLLDRAETGRDLGTGTGIGTRPINGRGEIKHLPPHDSDINEIIETSYIILDTGKEQQPIEEYEAKDGLTEKPEEEELGSEFVCSVKNIILDSLEVEVGRRLGLSDMKEMESNLALDLKHVAEVVSLAVGNRKELTASLENESASGDVCPLLGEDIIQTISSAVKDSIYLKKVLPVGVIVGSSLAALKNHFNVATQDDNGYIRGTFLEHANNVGKKLNDQVSEIGNDHKLVYRKRQYSDVDSSIKAIEKPEAVNNDTVMVGAVTVALGASALLAHQQMKDSYNSDRTVNVSPKSPSKNGNQPKEHENSSDVDEKDPNHIVSSLAEKAMSVAGPVVPTKSDGGVDQERLVAMLSDLGQKGGILRMIGKLALLWGGIRGAVSLTDRLISFLHIADRPLLQRLLGFACMVLVLWSPVVIPLFPTLVKGWAAHNSTGIAEYACIIGLYTAVTILIVLWGKRIRGYKDPLGQYGLDLTSKEKLLDFLKGLVGGVMLVLSIHSLNALLGFAHFSWYSSLPFSSPPAMALLKAWGRLLLLAGRGIVTATVVVIVEEIIFRSWLPEEISLDIGYHGAVIISGFAFSILQRSLHSIPGLWLLSIALSGLRQRSEGSLSIPIGIRAGVLSSSFILQTGGFVIYNSSFPQWLVGAHPLQPFDGAVGLAFCIVLAMLLYPNQPLGTKKIQRAIRE